MILEYEKKNKKTKIAECDTFEELVKAIRTYSSKEHFKIRYFNWIFFTDDDHISEVRLDYGDYTKFFWISELSKDFRQDLRKYSDDYIEEVNNSGFKNNI